MSVERKIRAVAGAVVLSGLALGTWGNHGWFFLSAFAGLNLFQSAFTGFCPLENWLRTGGGTRK